MTAPTRFRRAEVIFTTVLIDTWPSASSSRFGMGVAARATRHERTAAPNAELPS